MGNESAIAARSNQWQRAGFETTHIAAAHRHRMHIPLACAQIFIGKRPKIIGVIVFAKIRARYIGALPGAPCTTAWVRNEMGPKSKRKPINVLTGFITTWIRRNSTEALPFDSFESLRGRYSMQKDVERWIFNCNYTYYRLGNLLYQTGSLPHKPDELHGMLDNLGTTFKSISDATPLNLRSRPNDAAVHELARDWPPFQPESRNTLDHLDENLSSFASAYRILIPSLEETLASFSHDLTAEARLFSELCATCAQGSRALVTRCQILLPLWILADINPMMSLLLWNDVEAVQQLVNLLFESFSSWNSAGSGDITMLERWRSVTLHSQTRYLEAIDDDDASEQSLSELAAMLDAAGFSLDEEQPAEGLPRWLTGKAQLIWNIVLCTILGPGEMVGSTGSVRGSTASVCSKLPQAHGAGALRGEVLLRRRYHTGRIETIDRLLLDAVCAPGIWHVIGDHYDAHTPLPTSDYREQYLHLGTAYVQSELLDAQGSLAEGAGDSRFHVELTVRMDGQGRAHIVARDLGSKNGTHITRGEGSDLHVFAFPGRRHLTSAAWAERLDIDEARITMVIELELERGDFIQLAGSCFELI